MNPLRLSIVMWNSFCAGAIAAITCVSVATTCAHASAEMSMMMIAMLCSKAFRGVADRSPKPMLVIVITAQ